MTHGTCGCLKQLLNPTNLSQVEELPQTRIGTRRLFQLRSPAKKKEGFRTDIPTWLRFFVEPVRCFACDGTGRPLVPSLDIVEPCEVLRGGLEGGFSLEAYLGRGLSLAPPLGGQKDGVAVGCGVDSPPLVFCGPVRLEQDGNCLYVRAIVSALDLSLLIVLDSDAGGGEILDGYGCRLLFHFSEKFLLCLCVLGFQS
jgi:hypothetical protein